MIAGALLLTAGVGPFEIQPGPPSSSRVTVNCPPPYCRGAADTCNCPNSANTFKDGIPALEGGNTADAAQANQSDADKRKERREIDDLSAQESMADSTKAIVRLTRWQMWIGGIGLFLLLGTIIYTHLSYRLVKRTSQAELRAYMSLVPSTLHRGTRLYVRVTQGNFGQTPAMNARFWINAAIRDHPLADDLKLVEDDRQKGINIVAPGHKFNVSVPVSGYTTIAALKAIAGPCSGHRIYVICEIRYEDVFGIEHFTRACWSYVRRVYT